jgi:ubiquinone/menaquinone biosynthesis C-methylase UbiE
MERDYEKVAKKFWSLPQKPGEEANRDRLFMDDQILHDHLERVIRSRLDGVETVLDAGGGSGRFSLWLAGKGYRVTHLDISQPMLALARKQAADLGIQERVTFVEGRLTELSGYGDGQFDLVLSLDAPVSYTYPKQMHVIQELVRIASKGVVLCVSSLLGGYPARFHPASKKPYLTDETDPDTAVRWYMHEWAQREGWTPNFEDADRFWREGLFEDPDRVYDRMASGGTPWPVTYAFRPEELSGIMERAGLADIRLGGPGALARTLPGDILRKLLYTEDYRQPFLEHAYRYDCEPSVCGMGIHSLVASGIKAASVLGSCSANRS